MDSTSPPDAQNSASSAPAPEVLKPREDDANFGTTTATAPKSVTSELPKKHRNTYRPSHKATFIALAVVGVILAVNAGILGFVIKNKADKDKSATGQVSISAEVLNKLGVNTTAIGSSGVELTVDPNAKFNGKVMIAGDVDITGQFKLGSKLLSNEAGITRLEAGDTSLAQLDVNGNSTLTNLNIRSGLIVAGATQLQGTVVISQLLTVNNSLNLLGNLAVGGTISTAGFVARDLASTGTLTIGGHLITQGSAPSVGAGGALGSNGTVSISGNDTAGRVAINIGVGAVAGTLANVTFRSSFTSLPRVVISPIGVAATFYISAISAGGFSVAVGSGLPPGGYAIDYIVAQ